ncbi:MAG: ATP-binding cassette domain-containing protein [Candidatus Nanohaloarchaea archaeon]
MSSGKAIRTSELTKIYGDEKAVDGLSLEVESGEIFGLLGPNGAGKTTTTGMLTTLVKPTSGSAEVNGFDVVSEQDRVRESIGVVFQESALDDRLTGRENMEFHARMYGMGKTRRREKIEEMLELVDLSGDADRQVEDYSGGMKRRLEIARGLIQEPEVLFLDEPTLGLDAETRRSIWEYINDLNDREDMTIVLTTHYMEEADFLCDRVSIMREGNLVATDSPASLKGRLGGDIVKIKVEGGSGVREAVEELGWVEKVEFSGEELSVTTENAEKHVAELVDLVESKGGDIESLNLRKPSLEDVFLHLTGNRIAGRKGLGGGEK